MTVSFNQQIGLGSVQVENATIVEAIAGWCSGMSGGTPIRTGMRLLAESLDAKIIVISRVSKAGHTDTNIVTLDRRDNGDKTPKLDRSFAELVMGRYFGKSKSGTLWFSSMLDGMVDPALKMFQKRAQLRELVVLPMIANGRHVDFIELHFTDRLDAEQLGLLNMAVATLSQTWAQRTKGLFSEAALSKRRQLSSVEMGVPLLDLTNPAGLSRCEYRICMLLSCGLSNEAIYSELTITPSTLRSHLRNIYAKTECVSLTELTYKLLSHPTSQRPSHSTALQIA